MRTRLVNPMLALAAALSTASCCTTPDFSLPDFRGRLDFSGSLAFDFDFDADMEFDFDGDFSGWANLDVVTSASLGIDVSGLVAFEQEIQIDIDDDGVEETVSVIGFGDGDPDDIEIIVATWEGDEFTFDEDYCYVLVVTEETITLITGPCGSESPVLTCTSPADDPDDVSCEVCDENGECARCESEEVSECIEEGSDVLDEREPEPEPASTLDAGPSHVEPDAEAPRTIDAGETPEPSDEPTVDGGMMTSPPDAGATTPQPEPDVTQSAEYQTCLEQVSTLEASVALCGLSLTIDADTLCRTSLATVQDCFSSIDGLSFLENPCDVLEGDDCSEFIE